VFDVSLTPCFVLFCFSVPILKTALEQTYHQEIKGEKRIGKKSPKLLVWFSTTSFILSFELWIKPKDVPETRAWDHYCLLNRLYNHKEQATSRCHKHVLQTCCRQIFGVSCIYKCICSIDICYLWHLLFKWNKVLEQLQKHWKGKWAEEVKSQVIGLVQYNQFHP
jgi:hypothetical protein